jgi:RHS repeat-associated protein
LVTRYQWDENGNLDNKTVRDLVYDYDYNEANQLKTSNTWRLEHTGNGNSKGNSGNGAHKNNGTQEDWDQHHEDQSHYFEYLWDTKVNLSQLQLVTQHQYDGNGNLIEETTTSADGIETQAYHHDVYNRLTGIDTKYGAQVRFDYDSRDRRIKSAQIGWTDIVNADSHQTSADYVYTSLYDGRQELSQYNQVNGNQALYRQLTYLPNQVAGLYGQLLKQTLSQWQNQEFDATGWGEDLAPALYFHSDYQNSTIKVTGQNGADQYRYGYTPMGQTYGFKHRYSDEQMTRTFSSHSPNRNVVQNLYTGKYAEPLTGLAQMDARWYDAQKGRFIQADQYNHANLMLPKGAQSELMRFIGRSQSDLLRDPAQQMRYGYVSGNALAWVDPLGLVTYFIGGGGDKNDFWSIFTSGGQEYNANGTGNMGQTRDRMVAEGTVSNSDSVYVGYEDKDEILENIKDRVANGEEINLVGHSFGGDIALDLAVELEESDIQVETLITLDPVDNGYDRPESTPSNVNLHVNIYQQQGPLDFVSDIPVVGGPVAGAAGLVVALVSPDYKGSDAIATAGGQMGSIQGAVNSPTTYNHDQSTAMYRQALGLVETYNNVANSPLSPLGFGSCYD